MKKFIDNFEEYVGATLFGGMFAVLLLQIFFRQVLDTPLVWSEQLSMTLFVYIALLGVSSCIKNFEHVGIDTLVGKFSPRVNLALEIIRDVVTFGCIAFLGKIGLAVAIRKEPIELVALHISSSWVYGALPVIAVLMMARFIQGVVKKDAYRVKGEK